MQTRRNRKTESGNELSPEQCYRKKVNELRGLRLRVDQEISRSHLLGDLTQVQTTLETLQSQTEVVQEASRNHLSDLKATLGVNLLGYEEWNTLGFHVRATALAPP